MLKIERVNQTLANAYMLESLRMRAYDIHPQISDYDTFYIKDIEKGIIVPYVALIDNVPVAGCYVTKCFNTLYIEYVFVIHELQEKGLHLGQKLLEYVLSQKEQLEEYFDTEFTRSKLYPSSEKSRAIYLSMGYTECTEEHEKDQLQKVL